MGRERNIINEEFKDEEEIDTKKKKSIKEITSQEKEKR